MRTSIEGRDFTSSGPAASTTRSARAALSSARGLSANAAPNIEKRLTEKAGSRDLALTCDTHQADRTGGEGRQVTGAPRPRGRVRVARRARARAPTSAGHAALQR
jgi:hypothetical protein